MAAWAPVEDIFFPVSVCGNGGHRRVVGWPNANGTLAFPGTENDIIEVS